ncbi:tyrosine-type recombinase/integrase [Meiothermus rufus]|uniref:tyrosine-type recombinase/integrase n=1 Tax=Meiothermus rufus TaxID=604332 RepID=UPI000412E65E|nr:tyrosine-type recombinase/integrase [Meiothermus rufus]
MDDPLLGRAEPTHRVDPLPRPAPLDPALEERLEAFARYLRLEKGHAPRGVEKYLRDVRAWHRFLERRGLGETPEAVRALLEERSPGPRRARALLAALRTYCRWRRRVRGEAVEDVTEPVARPRAGARLAVHPERAELARFLEALQGEPEEGLLRRLALFLYGTGLRISEALSLRRRDLVTEGRFPSGPADAGTPEGGAPAAVRVVGKGDKERLVPLSPAARRALAGCGADRLFVFEARGPGRRVGKVPTATWVLLRFRAAAVRAGLDPRRFTPHKFRHAFGTALVEEGVPVDAVKELLGHASIATTQVYLHASARRLRQAVQKLPEVGPGQDEG